MRDIAPLYSARLGRVTPAQFQAALDRFGLGRFQQATPVPFGLFGQNVFLTSSSGEFVLRGCPHYPDQFPGERFFARLLHERTAAPVPWPYLLDPSEDIFGWSYALLPRMAGLQLADPAVRAALAPADRLAVARAMGTALSMLHALTWPEPGRYDLATDTIQPLAGGYERWLLADIRRWLARAQAHDERTTAADAQWAEAVIAAARPALRAPFQACCVHQDFKEGNATVARDPGGGQWRVSGIFDLMEMYFGDPEADLVRSVAGYLDEDPALARAFVAAYRECRPPRPGFAERFPLYMLRDRLIFWEYFHRPDQRWPAAQTTLPEWASRYMRAEGW